MENINCHQSNEKKFADTIDYLLQLTKSHFCFLTHPLSDQEDKVTSTNIYLNQLFKGLASGFAYLSQNIEISNLLHLMKIKNIIGLEDSIKVDKISIQFKPVLQQYDKMVQTMKIEQTQDEILLANLLFFENNI